MEEKLEAIKNLLNKYNQNHLLNHYDGLSEENKHVLLNQILMLDFPLINTLYEEALKEKTFEDIDIKPIEFLEKSKLTPELKQEFTTLGETSIKNHEFAVVTMAGGQGTRLGHSGPKGTFEVSIKGKNYSIFEILCQKLKKAYDKYNVHIPWYLMTSRENNKDTIAFFEKNNYFGYPKEYIRFFIQGELPMVDTKGKILLDENRLIKLAANGHGGIFSSMLDSGTTYNMKTKGIKWVFISGVDNILANFVDPEFIGFAIKNNSPAAGKSVVKASPDEKVGVFCKKNGKPSVIEYSEISKELAEAKATNGELLFAESHLLLNLFSLDAIENISQNKLPYHSAFKKADFLDENGNFVKGEEPNSYKFESFLFDAFESLSKMDIFRVLREDEFAPIKNASGVDSPETAVALYENWLDKN